MVPDHTLNELISWATDCAEKAGPNGIHMSLIAALAELQVRRALSQKIAS